MQGYARIIGYDRAGRPIFSVAGGQDPEGGDGGADPDPAPGDPKTDPNPDPDADAGDGEPFDLERAKAKIKRANAEAKALRERAKAAEARVAELEDAGKSELEKATNRAQEAEKKAQEAALRALRLEVAAEKGLTPAQAKRLIGTTKEELEADADELLESFKPEDTGTPPGGRPKERLRGGTDPTEEPEPSTKELLDKIPRL